MKQECCNINDTVQTYYHFIKAFVLKRVSDLETAEDIVQDVMFQLVKAHQKDIAVNHMKAWLFQVTRHTLAQHFKQDTENQSHLPDIDIAFEADFSSIITADYIVPMIGLLPEEYAQPLLMSDIEGIPQKEIASSMNLSLSNTKARIQRGRKKLRALFTECCHLDLDQNGQLIGCTIKTSCDPLHDISKKINS